MQPAQPLGSESGKPLQKDSERSFNAELESSEKIFNGFLARSPDLALFYVTDRDIEIRKRVGFKSSLEFLDVLENDNIIKFGKALKEKANLNAEDEHGFPLFIRVVQHSIREKGITLLKYVIGKGIKTDAEDQGKGTGLMWAAFSGNTEILDYMRTVPSIIKTINHEDTSGNTALFYALGIASTPKAYRLENFEKLIASGADPAHVNKSGSSLLMQKILSKQYEVVNVLLQNQSVIESINRQDSKGNTAVIYATQVATSTDSNAAAQRDLLKKRLIVMKNLIINGADPSISNKAEKNAFSYANMAVLPLNKEEDNLKYLLKDILNVGLSSATREAKGSELNAILKRGLENMRQGLERIRREKAILRGSEGMPNNAVTNGPPERRNVKDTLRNGVKTQKKKPDRVNIRN